jgi:hypothetical protein
VILAIDPQILSCYTVCIIAAEIRRFFKDDRFAVADQKGLLLIFDQQLVILNPSLKRLSKDLPVTYLS